MAEELQGASREARNAAIEHALTRVQKALREAVEAADQVAEKFQNGNSLPKPDNPNKPELSTPRPITVLLGDLPGDLNTLTEGLNELRAKIENLQHMIL